MNGNHQMERNRRIRVMLAMAGICCVAQGVLAADAPAKMPPAPPAGHKLDWYAWAEVNARPYMTMVYNLCDGDLATGARYVENYRLNYMTDYPNGGRVEFLVREVEDGSRILYLANWGYQPVTPVIGLDLSPGQYGVTLCGGAGSDLKEGLIDGKPEAAAAAFQSLSVPLAPREVLLMHVAPVKGK